MVWKEGVKMRVQQVELHTLKGHEMVVWVDAGLRLKRNDKVTGREDGIQWVVVKVYKKAIEITEINRGWAVGGITPSDMAHHVRHAQSR